MSRSSQPMGLPSAALEFLAANEDKPAPCPTCGHQGSGNTAQIGSYGMFDELSLVRYQLTRERWADEYIQFEEWWSGPMTWLGLRVSDGTEFKWAAEEIAPNLYGGWESNREQAIADVRARLETRDDAGANDEVPTS